MLWMMAVPELSGLAMEGNNRIDMKEYRLYIAVALKGLSQRTI